jgi:uncharacterized protein involved in exopolysaccharide biosynthesis
LLKLIKVGQAHQDWLLISSPQAGDTPDFPRAAVILLIGMGITAQL